MCSSNTDIIAVCTDLAKNIFLILWYTEWKAKFTQALQMMYTGMSSANLDFARFVQLTAVFAS